MNKEFCYAKKEKSKFQDLLNIRQCTKELALYLGGEYSKCRYEELRAEIISRYGYNKFRDIQSRAFELICAGLV